VQKIVLDLRTFSREGSDLMEAVKVEDIIDSVLGIVQNELKYKAELKKNYGDTPLVMCSPQRIGQVFINFLINSAQAIEEKGTIEIKTYSQNGYVCIDFSDTGRGIKPEDLTKVFDPFFTTKPVGQGTGLGLSVSYEIVMKHNGDINVRSEVGRGTTFTVMLPIPGGSDENK
jgi:signal transduction histidine kinase